MSKTYRTPSGSDIGNQPEQLQVRFTITRVMSDAVLLPPGVAEALKHTTQEAAVGYLRGLGYLDDLEIMDFTVTGVEIVDIEKFEVWNG